MYKLIGFIEPFTVTLSISLNFFYTACENFENIVSLNNTYTPYYFVADSKRAAIFTFIFFLKQLCERKYFI